MATLNCSSAFLNGLLLWLPTRVCALTWGKKETGKRRACVHFLFGPRAGQTALESFYQQNFLVRNRNVSPDPTLRILKIDFLGFTLMSVAYRPRTTKWFFNHVLWWEMQTCRIGPWRRSIQWLHADRRALKPERGWDLPKVTQQEGAGWELEFCPVLQGSFYQVSMVHPAKGILL